MGCFSSGNFFSLAFVGQQPHISVAPGKGLQHISLAFFLLEACLNFCFKHQFDIEPLPCMKQFLSTLEKFILVSFPASRQPEGQQAYSFSSTHNSPLYIAVLLLVHEGDDYLIKLVMLHHWKKSINAMFLETEKSD